MYHYRKNNQTRTQFRVSRDSESFNLHLSLLLRLSQMASRRRATSTTTRTRFGLPVVGLRLPSPLRPLATFQGYFGRIQRQHRREWREATHTHHISSHESYLITPFRSYFPCAHSVFEQLLLSYLVALKKMTFSKHKPKVCMCCAQPRC